MPLKRLREVDGRNTILHVNGKLYPISCWISCNVTPKKKEWGYVFNFTVKHWRTDTLTAFLQKCDCSHKPVVILKWAPRSRYISQLSFLCIKLVDDDYICQHFAAKGVFFDHTVFNFTNVLREHHIDMNYL